MYLFAKLFFWLGKWEINGEIPSDLTKYIVVVGPHTSNWDFFWGVVLREILKLNHIKYIGKSQLFKPPYGFIFRALGGYPVYRKHNNNLVSEVVDIFNSKTKFAIGLAPEGTRKKVDRIKTGFYYIAKQTHIPIVLIGLDYSDKKVKIEEPFFPGNNIKTDFKRIIGFFSSCKGKHPENGISLDIYNNMKEKL